MMQTHVVIMAGGVGSRFWPMSTPEFPKQFVDVLGCGKTMLQMTVDRFAPLCPVSNFWIVTSSVYVDIVRSQLPQIPSSNILSEPCSRNTAPCIAYACWKIRARHPQANVVVTPADAYVADEAGFRDVMRKALDFTSMTDNIVTIGISPTRPETGYGYICVSDFAPGKICKVSSFKEKPDLQTAVSYISAGNFLWNAGIFVWNISVISEMIRKHVPELAGIMDVMSESFYTDRESDTVGRLFPSCDKISIDYAVMEKAEDIYTIPGSFGWSDVGTWGSLWSLLEHDMDGNAVVGDNVHLNGCRGCIVHAPSARSVVLEGLEDSIVVEREGRILVCRLSEEQRIKDFDK